MPTRAFRQRFAPEMDCSQESSKRLRRRNGGEQASVAESVRSNLPYLVVSIGLVQGLAYAIQLCLAYLLPPADFGIVRIVEATLSILVVLGAVGMPTLAIKSVAEVGDNARSRLIRRLIKISLCGGIAASALGAIVAFVVFDEDVKPYLIMATGITVLAAASRTGLNYFQGIQQIRKLAKANIALSAAAFGTVVGLTWWYGLGGWIIGRYLGEAIFLAGVIYLIYGTVDAGWDPPGASFSTSMLVKHGIAISAALAIRTTLNHTGLFVIGAQDDGTGAAGLYGFATLVFTLLMLVPAAAGSLIIPEFAKRVASGRDLVKEYREAARRMFMWTVALAVLGVAVSFFVVPNLMPEYNDALIAIVVLVVALPFRTTATVSGVVVMAYDKHMQSTITNLGLLGIAAVLSWLIYPHHSYLGVAVVFVAVEVFGFYVYRHLANSLVTRIRSRI